VRPDQFVANVLPLDGVSELSAFFDAFMIDPGTLVDDPLTIEKPSATVVKRCADSIVVS
jgi:hypothetical protein